MLFRRGNVGAALVGPKQADYTSRWKRKLRSSQIVDLLGSDACSEKSSALFEK